MNNFPVPANLCDVCRAPGTCCKDFCLSLTFWDDEDINVQWAREIERQQGFNGPLKQFVPVKRHDKKPFVDEESKQPYSRWRFRCTALKTNGRCGIYETRPTPCRLYKAGSDGMCAMFVGETNEPS